MRIPKAFSVAFFLLFFFSTAFALACSGVSDFSSQYSQVQGFSAGSLGAIDSFQETKNGTVMEFSNTKIGKLAQTAPIVLTLETSNQSKGKIYYALATTEDYFSTQKYDSISLFTWADAQGTNLLDGIQSNAKPSQCAKWANAKDAAMLDLSNYPAEQPIKLFTATATTPGTYFTLLCATTDVDVTVTKADKSGKKYTLGKGIFNGGANKMIPLNEAQEAEAQTFIGNVKEQVKQGNACIEDSKIKWNLAKMLEVSVKGLAKTPVEILLEPDNDNDNLPNETDPQPNTPQQPSSGQTYPGLAQGDGYTLLFLPLKWNHSLDSSTGTFEENVKEQSQYFIETAGIQTCKKITVKTLSEADIAGCSLQSLDMSGFDPYGALDLIKSCAGSKAGAQSNSGNLAVIALTNHPKMAVYDPSFGSGAVQTAGFTEPGGNIIIASIKSKAVPTHELGHLFFNFCDQYKFTEFVLQDNQRKRLGIPKGKGLSPGCQNKYPGPGGGQQYQLQISQTGLAVPSNFKPGQCPDYPKCSYETGSFLTCCANDKTDYHDCSGRFIPINGARGLSVMGAYYAALGDNLPRTYDCFEKEAIQKQAGCKIEASTVRETGAPAKALLEQDSDGDGTPDSAGTGTGQELETARAAQYLIGGGESAYTLLFIPWGWKHSKDKAKGTFEENVNGAVDYFIEKAGLQGCQNITVKLMDEKEAEACNLDTVSTYNLQPYMASDLVKRCIGSKAGLPSNSETFAAIMLTNADIIEAYDPYANSVFSTAAITEPENKVIFAVSLLKNQTIPHEIGHIFFNFCDQYKFSEFVSQDLRRKEAGIPSGEGISPGCQNKYPGPGGGQQYQIVVGEAGLEVPSGFDPQSCPDYPKCDDYETGMFVTCCANDKTDYHDCSGRFIPINGGIGVSVMGAYYKELGDTLLRDFDCFEKDAITKMAGC
ncbi:MAG: hypothetical protein V1493_04970 [Candidatus Diapherotrites archaeon]